MRILFFGTPAFAIPTLKKLLASKHQLLAVITQPDRPQGRGRRGRGHQGRGHQGRGERERQPSPPAVKPIAEAAGILVLQPVSIKDFLPQIKELEPECLLVAAYGQMLPRQLLELPEYGGINVHASLLPEYRGAAPINWAIINGDSHSGVTIMQMDEGMDSGNILSQARIPIDSKETAGSLHDNLAHLGAELLLSALAKTEQGHIGSKPQDESEVSYAPSLSKTDGLIDWTQAADVIERRIRGLSPWPGTYTYLEGMRLKLLEAEVVQLPADKAFRPGQIIRTQFERGLWVVTGKGGLIIQRLQPESRAAMGADQYLAGQKESPAGKIFSSQQ